MGGDKTSIGRYGSTYQSERIRLGDTCIHNGAPGRSGTSTAGVDTGFNREPGGRLNPMAIWEVTRSTTTEKLTQPDPSGQEKNPYLYAEGDPVNRIEPSGQFSLSDVLDIGEKVVTGRADCLAATGAAADSGTLTAATGLFGTPGTVTERLSGWRFIPCGPESRNFWLLSDLLAYDL
ncbi:hypothetical protein AB0D14_44095 [Streptomyces sp. NPDC048484]|uniref:hypothetical protein n=1 Tax=Streptomyces sp. NPDC048484 TaxID=3155146 RepID=UPI00342F07A7